MHTQSHTCIYTLNSGIHSEPQMSGCWAVIWRPESDWIMTTKNSYPFWVSCAGCQSWHISHLIPAAALLVRNSQFTFTEEETETAESCKTGTTSPLPLKFNSWHMGWHPVNVCWMTTLLESQPPKQGFDDTEGLVGASTQHFCFSKGLAQFFKAITLPKHQVLVTSGIVLGDLHQQMKRVMIFVRRELDGETIFSALWYASIFKIQNNNLHVKHCKNFFTFFQL